MDKVTLILDDTHDAPHTESCEEIKSICKQVAKDLDMNYAEDRIVACETCKHFACVCGIIVMHNENCPFRKAATCAVAIECDHGFDVCPECDPCTCKE